MDELNLKKKKKKIWLIATAVVMTAAVIAGIAIAVFSGKDDSSGEKQAAAEPVYIDPHQLGLSGYSTYEYLSDGDEDGDGLTNGEEEKLGTDVLLVDTDEDGISDYAETNDTNTNPLEADTDGDGLTDGDEVSAGLNPNEKKSDGETSDRDVSFKETIGDNKCSVNLEGNAEIYSAYIEKADITGLSKTPGVLSDVYDYCFDKNTDSAQIAFQYESRELKSRGIDAENLSVCEYRDGSFEPIESEIDKDKSKVTAYLRNSSRYALCNMETINTEATPQVLLLIDNSGSMYPKDVAEGSDENDVDFKRLDMASRLIDMAGDKIKFGLAKFTGSYTLMAETGSDKETLNEKIESIRTGEEVFNGTYIETSLMKSIGEFEKNDNEHRNFVVMLTDGCSTEGQGLFSFKMYDEEDIIKKANDYNITLIIIGLGNNVDTTSLTKMANGTDGMYIGAYNADALEQVYEKIMSAINYNFEDVDGDGENDRILIADSGFTAKDNGFPYDNYRVISSDGQEQSGQCFGIASLCQLYYMGKLPVTMESVEGLGTGFLGLTGELSSPGYNADGSFFVKESGSDEKASVLNNVAMGRYTNKTLEIYQKIQDIPANERYVNEDGYLKFTDEVEELINSDPLITKKKKTTSKQKYEDWEYTAYDDWYISFYNVDQSSLTEEQLQSYKDLTMIFRLYALQLEDTTETFSVNNADFESNSQLKAMDRLIGMVEEGTPAVISSCGHSINITKIYRDLDDTNEYTLVVYNNNEAGEEYELTIERRKSKIALDMTEWLNDYIYTIYDKDGTFTGEKGKKINMDIDDISAVWE